MKNSTNHYETIQNPLIKMHRKVFTHTMFIQAFGKPCGDTS